MSPSGCNFTNLVVLMLKQQTIGRSPSKVCSHKAFREQLLGLPLVVSWLSVGCTLYSISLYMKVFKNVIMPLAIITYMYLIFSTKL